MVTRRHRPTAPRALPLPACRSTRLAALAGLVLYAATLVLVHVDSSFSARWVTFALWLLSVAAIPAALLFRQRDVVRCGIARLRRFRSLPLALVLLLLAVAFSFALLMQYPYVAIYDQVRDGGLNAREIYTGELRNLAGYGRYGSHGAVIPTVAAFFYRFFGSSVLTYRVPAALLAVLDVGLIYLLMRRAAGRMAGGFAALILLTLPLHLYYGRTELVVIFSSVLMTVILLVMQRFLADPSWESYLLLGVTLGFIANFHGAIVTVVLVTLVLAVMITVYKGVRTRPRAPLVLGVLLMLLFFLVGFGPKLLFVRSASYLHSTEAFYATDQQPDSEGVVLGTTLRNVFTSPGTLARNYLTSLLVYVHEPTRTTHYPDWQPLLDPLVAGLFLIGLSAAIVWSSNATVRLAAVYAAVIPFTNSAMTNSINGDNRLMPALPVAAALAGYGAALLVGLLRRGVLTTDVPAGDGGPVADVVGTGRTAIPLRYAALALGGLTVLYLLVRGVLFFVNQPATKGYTADDYLSMRAIYFIQSHPAYRNAEQLCMAVSPRRYAYFGVEGNLLLVSEQYQYFVPGHTFHIFSSPDVQENELYLSTGCNASLGHHFDAYTYCKTRTKFTCPPTGELKLYAENAGAPARPAEGLAFLGVPWVLDPKPVYVP